MPHHPRESARGERLFQREKIQPADLRIRNHESVRLFQSVLPQNPAQPRQQLRADEHRVAAGTKIDIDA